MAHGDNKAYKVCIYSDIYATVPEIERVFRTYEKAKKFISDYEKRNPKITRAFIETVQSFKNDKRNMWR